MNGKVYISNDDRRRLKSIGLHAHTCAICGKEFEARAEYVYKVKDPQGRNLIWMCSYSCMTKYLENKKKRRA